MKDKIKIKSRINIFSYFFLIIGGIGITILGTILIQNGIEKVLLMLIGIIFLIIGIYSIYWIFNFEILEITDSELIIKSIIGKTKKKIPLKEFTSFNEIKKQNAQTRGEPAHMKWNDLTLIGKSYSYKVSSLAYSNYPELRRVLTKGLKRNKASEVEWNRKNGKYFGLGFVFFGIIVGLWLGITPKDINDKIIGGTIGFIFLSYGIYLIIKNKKPTANNV
ncbi:MAG: hypothetical protein GY739_10550 [Mesoflavibacter sp.]|nr:hypothetical protein [Mesoflavibacter sp.]